MGMIDEVARA